MSDQGQEARSAAQRSRQELEDYADSLFGELEAERHAHRKDNEYLLQQAERMLDALSSILTTVEDASVPYERLKVGSLARAGLGEA